MAELTRSFRVTATITGEPEVLSNFESTLLGILPDHLKECMYITNGEGVMTCNLAVENKETADAFGFLLAIVERGIPEAGVDYKETSDEG